MNKQAAETLQQVLDEIDTYISRLENIASCLERLYASTCKSSNPSEDEQKIHLLQRALRYAETQWETEMDKVEALQAQIRTH